MIMKRFAYAIALVATLFCASSCEETIFEKDGDWDPIELDKTHVNFPPEGGQNTVSALNYSRWWINGGYESSKTVDPLSGDGNRGIGILHKCFLSS